ncbi:MAG: NAD-dependent epimerase/dehydratase [Amycolatopsis sp.]|jgi:nucleoside-diphosphate-sugar epimerase|uniref:SDR family oxidoreductase n=1 Tax=Amycolatopsis sp. TaxID=37632 RepID=UPI00261E62EB|nr:SDR family oxidoreductase [Amycolatopsis sp.]MCU1686935.1 NAD-dependent epimerase/dehydratase [Amycolatopsis sp.]
MHVFVTGGSGLTGPAIVTELITAGHTVTGLARSNASADRLEALGATPFPGSLEDVDALRAGAARADGVVHMAIAGSFSDRDDLMRRDVAAISTLGEALVGTDKPFVSTSGTLVMPTGRVSDEQDPPDAASHGAFRVPGEQACLGFGKRGVRSSVVRLAPTVHGPGDFGFIPVLVASARKTGVSAYIGDGENRWPTIHRLDAARLFRLALEKAPAGTALHGAGEEGVTLKSIAEKIGEILGVPTRSLAPEEAGDHFDNPFLGVAFGIDAPVSSARTQQLLGWAPTHATLLEDLETGDYFALPVS